MKKIVFTEEFCSPENLFPFTLTRQIQDIRVGILTIREKWERLLQMPSFDKQEGDYKDLERAMVIETEIGNDTVLLLHGNILPNQKLVDKVLKLKPGQCLSVPERENIAYCFSRRQVVDTNKLKVEKAILYTGELKEIRFPWDIFHLNNWALREDFALLTKRRKSAPVPASNRLLGKEKIFIEKGAAVAHCYLNTTDGPIYIGRNAHVMEGSMLKGPLCIGEGAVVKMGARLYGGTIGPYCVVGGEIKNSVLFGFSNKAHDGYIGDSVIGEWCNMGAGTTNSNIKNTASEIKVFTPGGLKDVGLKCGVLMGDYTRTAINTSINTGTVIGACAHVFGTGLTPKYVPSFSWGSEGISRYRFDKAMEDIRNWKRLKHHVLTDTESSVLKHIFDHY